MAKLRGTPYIDKIRWTPFNGLDKRYIIENESFDSTEAAFNCDSSVSCNYLSFEASANCNDHYDDIDYNTSFYASYVTDVCVPYINTFNATNMVIRCYDDRLEFDVYSEANCTVYDDATVFSNLSAGCSVEQPSRLLMNVHDHIDNNQNPKYFELLECTVVTTRMNDMELKALLNCDGLCRFCICFRINLANGRPYRCKLKI